MVEGDKITYIYVYLPSEWLPEGERPGPEKSSRLDLA
jgi:hypothetical protein